MASFAEILAKKPKVQTRQALMVIGLQNDFITPTGHLPVNDTSGFLDRIYPLINKFRELNGNIIWVQTVYEADRLANTSSTGEGDALVIAGLVDGEENSSQAGEDEPARDQPVSVPQAQSRSAKHKQRALDLFKRVSSRRKALPVEEAKVMVEEDEELFLLKRAKKGAACMPDTEGAQFTEKIRGLVETPRDALIKTSNYSAFLGTNLLLTLRARLITEIYVCGCFSNISVLATVIDGARHGIKINVIEDALGFRRQARHDLAMRRMEDFFDAYLVTAADVLAKEHFEVIVPVKVEEKAEAKDDKSSKELEKLVGKLTLNERPKVASTPRDDSAADNSATRPLSTGLSGSRTQETPASEQANNDEDILAALARARRTKGAEQQPTDGGETKLVQSKTRMRRKTKKKNKTTEGSLVEPSTPRSEPKSETKDAADSAQPAAATLKDIDSLKNEALDAEAEGKKPQESDTVQQLPDVDVAQTPLSGQSEQVGLTDAVSTKTQPLQSDREPPVTDATSPSISATQHINVSPSQPRTLSAEELTSSETILVKSKKSKLKSLANLPVLGPNDHIAEGDSRIVHNLIPLEYHDLSDHAKPLVDTIFQDLYNEVHWQKMLHQQGEVPRLVCCQGELGDDGSKPVYRHPTDQTLPLLHFSPKVQWIRRAAEKVVGHSLNHVLIQLYRSGNDYISEHSDKTLDIAKGSSIVNVSFGAQRTMRLRSKKESKPSSDEDTQRETQRVAMPHNSLFVLGLKSNEKWLHGIMADKRLKSERSDFETAYSGARISLTFRNIATFLDARETIIWGQGATSKDQRGAADVVNNDEAEAERMIRAFSRENHSNGFDWHEWYGDGFDVLHLHAPPEQLPILFASGSLLETNQVQLALWESKVSYSVLEAPYLDKVYALQRRLMFRDNDEKATEVDGVSAILHYIDRYHSFCADKPVTAASYALLELFSQTSSLAPGGSEIAEPPVSAMDALDLSATLHTVCERLQGHGGPFIAGKRFSIADCVIWPVLDDLFNSLGTSKELPWPELAEYYRLAWKKKACLKKLRAELPLMNGKM
ncbi:hypothetical protein G6514_002344 [Epicoccum nigrum]|nr:hypothetical protein G6514_002344 [Epicoccum nigrum]